MDESGILDTIAINRATPVKRSLNHPRHLKASKTSLEDETLREMDSCTETRNTSSLLKDSDKETVTTSPLFRDSYTEREILPHGSKTPVRRQ